MKLQKDGDCQEVKSFIVWGEMRVFVAQINPTIGDVEGNTRKVLAALQRAHKAEVEVVLFPELVLSGYPPEDLLLDEAFIAAIGRKIPVIAPYTQGLFVAVGLPRKNPSQEEKPLYNSAAIFIDGQQVGFQDKILLPTYDVFDERRFFEPGAVDFPLWMYRGRHIGVTICEDLWEHAQAVGWTHYRVDPVLQLRKQKPDLLLNLSASPYSFQRKRIRQKVLQAAAKALGCPTLCCNQVGANDQLVFDGHSLHINAQGECVQVAKGFVEEDFLCDLNAPSHPVAREEDDMADLYQALILGMRDYFQKQGFTHAILGLSGGIDSALTACIAVQALGADHVSALALPSRYSSAESVIDAEHLAKNLRIGLQRIDIDPLFQSYLHLFKTVFVEEVSGLTEQNIQARIRQMILMGCSNQNGALLLTTGNKSEMAMGYMTLYGDMAGGLGVLLDVTKAKVYALAQYVNREREIIPQAILKKAPSAELKPGQKTIEELYPFELLDPVIEAYTEQFLSAEEIADKQGISLSLVQTLIGRMHRSEYKRRQAPISIRVTQKAFSRGRQVPIVQKWR